MVYKEHGMWEVLAVLRRLYRGESRVVIAAATGMTRENEKRQVRAPPS